MVLARTYHVASGSRINDSSSSKGYVSQPVLPAMKVCRNFVGQ